jgi:DNA-binding NarL/FixJ family response regulator
VQVVNNRGAFTAALQSFAPDVLLADSGVPGFPALEALQLLREHLPPTPLILVCGVLEPAGLQCLKAGAADLLLKREVARLGPAIQAALEVRAPLGRLSTRQCAVLRRLAAGQSTKGIASELQISVKTIETHRAEAMKRLGIHDLAGLVRYAIQVGIVSALGQVAFGAAGPERYRGPRGATA